MLDMLNEMLFLKGYRVKKKSEKRKRKAIKLSEQDLKWHKNDETLGSTLYV